MPPTSKGLGCAIDRLQELAHHHATASAFLGPGDCGDRTQEERRTMVDTVSPLTPELLAAVGGRAAESGRKVA